MQEKGERVFIDRDRTDIEVDGTDSARKAIRRRQILVGLAQEFEVNHDRKAYILNLKSSDRTKLVTECRKVMDIRKEVDISSNRTTSTNF